jgi:hypothetical protein
MGHPSEPDDIKEIQMTTAARKFQPSFDARVEFGPVSIAQDKHGKDFGKAVQCLIVTRDGTAYERTVMAFADRFEDVRRTFKKGRKAMLSVRFDGGVVVLSGPAKGHFINADPVIVGKHTQVLPTLPQEGEIIRALIGDKQPDVWAMDDAEMAEYMRRDLAGEPQVPNTVEHLDGSATWNDQEIGMGLYATLPVHIDPLLNKALDQVGDEEGIVDLIVDLRREDDRYVMIAFTQGTFLYQADGSKTEL